MNIAKNHPDYIRWLLTMNDMAVERAIVAIYNRQTSDEKLTDNTRHSNGIGFAYPDARLGSYYARWVISGKHLTGQHLLKARIMSMKYIKQLVDIATSTLATDNVANNEERIAIQSE